MDFQSSSTSGTLTVSQDTTTTTASASSATPGFGQAVTITGIVTANSPGSGTPTGTIDFKDTTIALDLGTVSLSSGIATLSIASLPLGANTITLTYSGDSNFLTSNSSVTVTVGQSILVLDPTAGGALSLSGNANVNVPGTVIVDSNSSTALSASGNASLTAGSIHVVGNFQKSGSATFSPAPVTGVKAVADPLAGLGGPSATGMTNFGAVSISSGSQMLNQGVYSSITISGTASVKLNAGIYIIEGGGLTVSGSASLSGTGVLIYNTGTKYPSSGGSYGAITLSSNGAIKLTGPATGVYAGIVIDQDPNDTHALTFSGNAAGISGVIYAPKAQLVESGSPAQRRPGRGYAQHQRQRCGKRPDRAFRDRRVHAVPGSHRIWGQCTQPCARWHGPDHCHRGCLRRPGDLPGSGHLRYAIRINVLWVDALRAVWRRLGRS